MAYTPQAVPEEQLRAYETYIKRLEAYAREHPFAYRMRIRLLAALGHAYLFLWLGIFIALCLSLIVIVSQGSRPPGRTVSALEVGVLLAVFALFIGKALWIAAPPLEGGIELSRADAPSLFALIDKVCGELCALPIEAIYLHEKFNAGVFQYRRKGFMRGYANRLALGFPLMLALSPAQFRAVLGHELGHLSRQNSYFRHRIYQLRSFWWSLYDDLTRSPSVLTRLIFGTFYRWYVPFFSAYTFAFARADEYDADRASVEMTDVETAGSALVQVFVADSWLRQEFWEPLHKEVYYSPEPPSNLFERVAETLNRPIPRAEAILWMDIAVRVKTDYNDTHPAMAERLAAIGYSTEDYLKSLDKRSAPIDSAAKVYLGEQLTGLTRLLGVHWAQEAERSWEEGFTDAQEDISLLQGYHLRRETLRTDEVIEFARLLEKYESEEEAYPIYKQAWEADTYNPEANFHLGRVLLRVKDERGVAYLERAMQYDSDAVLPACRLLFVFCIDAERVEEANLYRRRYLSAMSLYEQAHEERVSVRPTDVFLPPELAGQMLEGLSAQLQSVGVIKEAYLVRKQVKFLSERAFFVLLVDIELPRDQAARESLLRRVKRSLEAQLDFPFEWQLLNAYQHERYWKRARKIPTALLFKR